MTLDELIDFDDWAMDHLPGILAYPVSFIWILLILLILLIYSVFIGLAFLIMPPGMIRRW